MFKKASERLNQVSEINSLNSTDVRFGISFLDDAFGGMYPDDLVIMTARTGAGKTELATQLAYTNASRNKNVHLFALEAYPGEIETRIFYRKLAEGFFLQQDWMRHGGETPNFQDWVYNKNSHLIGLFEKEVLQILSRQLKTLNTYYRDQNFSVETFEAQLARVGQETDLLICDHLHYFDLESADENKDLKRTVKKIRDLTLFYRKPTVLVAHIRKQDKRFQTLVPDIEDIYGSSDITKVATKIFAVAPATDISQSEDKPHIYPTYIRILKNRLDGSRSHYTAVCKFNIQQNCYEQEYCLGKIKSDGTFQESEHVPRWAKHHRSFVSGNGGRSTKSYYDKDAW